MDQGRRLGIGTVALGGALHQAATIELDTDGRVAAATPAVLEARLLGARMFALSAPEAADLLGTLATARADTPGSLSAHCPAGAIRTPYGQQGTAATGARSRTLPGGDLRRRGTVRRGPPQGTGAAGLLPAAPRRCDPGAGRGSLWPEVPLGRKAQWLRNALGNLRTVARRATAGWT
jgi:hypothetical protein